MSRRYNLSVPRFDPYKNIYVGVDSIIKICSNKNCKEPRAPLRYETYCKDSQRPYGFKSQCKACDRDYQAQKATLKKNSKIFDKPVSVF